MAHALMTLRTWLAARVPAPDDERGASLVEYSLLVALIAVVCFVAVGILGDQTSTSFSSTGAGFLP